MAETRKPVELRPPRTAGALPAQPDGAPAAPARSTDRRLWIVMAVLGAALLLALGGIAFLLLTWAPAAPGAPTEPVVTIVKPEDGPMLLLDEMVINVGGASSGHYARVRVALEFYDEHGYRLFLGIKEGEESAVADPTTVPNAIRARDALLDVLSSSTVADFDDVPALRERMREAVNRALFQPVIKQIHFVERAVQ